MTLISPEGTPPLDAGASEALTREATAAPAPTGDHTATSPTRPTASGQRSSDDAPSGRGQDASGDDASSGTRQDASGDDASSGTRQDASGDDASSGTRQDAGGEADAGGTRRASRIEVGSRPLGRLGRWREILSMLVWRDLQARSKQAFLGYLWILIQPLLLTGVFSVLVQQVLGRTDLSDIPYPVFLMAGVVPWQLFANSLNESTESLVKNVDLVRQVYFPREILAIYPVFARLVDVVIGSLALVTFMLVWHVPISGWVALVPLIVAEEMLFAAACGMLLSAANVAWRDVSRGLPLVLFLMLYAVPVLYPLERVPASVRPFVWLNPIAHLVDMFRASVTGTSTPDLGALALIGLIGIAAIILAQRIFSVFDGVLADVI